MMIIDSDYLGGSEEETAEEDEENSEKLIKYMVYTVNHYKDKDLLYILQLN